MASPLTKFFRKLDRWSHLFIAVLIILGVLITIRLLELLIRWVYKRIKNRARSAVQQELPTTVLTVPNFPTKLYSETKKQEETGEGPEECSVCLDEFKDDDIVKILSPCSHYYHVNCVNKWLKSHLTCPICRHDLSVGQNSVDRNARRSSSVGGNARPVRRGFGFGFFDWQAQAALVEVHNHSAWLGSGADVGAYV